jgi:peptidoglycan/LPS O-acetylase OafA/YrhL
MEDVKYIPALDGLRALAVGLVVLQDFSYRVAPGGNVGVDIFFVLSGFLITSVLLREHRLRHSISLGYFFARRALRLAPALVLMVGCVLLLEALGGAPDPYEPLNGLISVAYLMDFVRAFSNIAEVSPLGHTWSLSVEEQYYIIWPFLLSIFLLTRGDTRVLTPIKLIGVIVIWRMVLLQQGGPPSNRIYYSFDTRADQLLIGCTAALWLANGPTGRVGAKVTMLWPFALAGILLTAGFSHLADYFLGGLGFTAIGALAIVLILEIIANPTGLLATCLSHRFLVAIGVISYGVYLWHYPLLLLIDYWSGGNVLARAGGVILAVVVAFASHRFIERPFLRMKRGFEATGANASAQPGVDGAIGTL